MRHRREPNGQRWSSQWLAGAHALDWFDDLYWMILWMYRKPIQVATTISGGKGYIYPLNQPNEGLGVEDLYKLRLVSSFSSHQRAL
jgi:hypothetical protein